MSGHLEETIALLERTPAALNGLLRDLPEAWTRHNEGENTWSVFDVTGHLVHTEHVNWIPRAKWILEFGESKPFPRLDREGHRSLSAGKPLAQLLDEFAQTRMSNLAELRALNLQAADFECRGQHPALGAVTLGQLLSTWPAHDVNHLHQIARIMAHQYREAVGPWHRFLGVMHCNGHSAQS